MKLFTLSNNSGTEIIITDLGGTIVSVFAKDRHGNFDDIVLGYDSLDDYSDNPAYFGSIIGRFCNRIANARFTLDGVEYMLAKNNGENHLHGGNAGFNKAFWDTEELSGEGFTGLRLTHLSPDGEENYPGNLRVEVVYKLNNDNELSIKYFAETDKRTILNLTNHSYFNLKGAGRGDILDHAMMLNSDQFTPIDETLITTGELQNVEGTPLDFKTPAIIGDRIDNEHEQLVLGGGYDHNWVLNNPGGALIPAARVYEPSTGRILEVDTTQPGIQFYSGNFLNGTAIGKGGIPYHKRCGFCLETQHYPDSPNKPDFPSTVLSPGEKFSETTVYRFLAE
ncbi:aldose epimerase family protein [Candidatus Latescibacterota bacterium]